MTLRRVALRAVITAAAWLCNLASAQPQMFHIPPGDLAAALESLAKQTGLQLAFEPDQLKGIHTHGVNGTLSPEQAAAELIKGTSLTLKTYPNGEILISAPHETSVPTKASSTPGPEGAGNVPQSDSGSLLRMAQASQGVPMEAASVEKKDDQNPQRDSSHGAQLEEVVVTARKRTETLIETPQSVSVLSGDTLTKLGATQFRDYADSVPGLDYTTAGAGYTQITLRGVNTGFGVSPTVGIYVDDVPYGSSTPFAQSAQFALDLGPFDLERIEVLRGPQGTLYGASTMGGLIKYVTKQPDSAGFGVDLQTGISHTVDGSVNYNVAGAVNVPIVADKAALRLSGYESHDGGYVYNVALHQSNVNRSDVYGGRLDLSVTPTEALTIRLTGFLQNISRDGEGTVDYTLAGMPIYGGLDQYRKFAEPFDQQFRLVSAKVAYDFGPATLTSISSYQTLQDNNIWDVSAVYVPLLNGIFGPTYGAVGDANENSTDKFTQEVRLSSAPGRLLEWLVGGFYNHEVSHNNELFLLRDPAGNPLPNDLLTYLNPSTYKEYAAYADLTWHVSRKFDVTGGLRYAHDSQDSAQVGSGAFVEAGNPHSSSSETVVTYLGNARYRFNDQETAYIRYATGYRPGGPNYPDVDPTTGKLIAQPSFDADHLQSYEVGFKVETSDRRYGVDIDVYDINWSNIQLDVIRNGIAAITNAAGGAGVQGAELTLTAHPVPALTATGAFAYQHAYLKKSDADLGATAGERLPNTPPFTGVIAADYALPVESWWPTVGFSLRYIDDRTASFNGNASYPQYHLPAYTTVDLRTGVTLGAVNLQLYVHNLCDQRGQIGDILPQFGTRIAIEQPRTIGISATTHF